MLLAICGEYVVSKQHREQFSKEKVWRARNPLEFIHFNICGPVNQISNEKENILFFLLMIIVEKLGSIFAGKI